MLAHPSPPASPAEETFKSVPRLVASSHLMGLYGPGQTEKPVKVSVVYGHARFDHHIDLSLPLYRILWNAKNVSGKRLEEEVNSGTIGGWDARDQQRTSLDVCFRMLETDELVTEENYRRFIKDGANLKLMPSQASLARMLSRDLQSQDEQTVKRALFSLRKYLQEQNFAEAFSSEGGHRKLQRIIIECQGNTLAYALSAILSAFDGDRRGDCTIDEDVVQKLVSIVLNESLVNVCRPATAILTKLVYSPTQATVAPIGRGHHRKMSHATKQSVGRNGLLFAVVAAAITSKRKDFVAALILRISSADSDYLIRLYSLRLINAMIKGQVLPDSLDSLKELRVAVLRWMLTTISNMSSPPKDGHSTEELMKEFGSFQRALVSEGYLRRRMRADPKRLEELAKLASWVEGPKLSVWKVLGFETGNPQKELSRSGMLGLDAMSAFAAKETDTFITIIGHQISPSMGQRMAPFARACMDVIDLLSDYWQINTGCPTSQSAPQPLLLALDDIFCVTLLLYMRVHYEDSAVGDLRGESRVSQCLALVRTHFRYVARTIQEELLTPDYSKKVGSVSEPEKLLLERFRTQMLDTSVKTMRERLLSGSDFEEALMEKLPLRKLRDNVHRQSFQYVKHQRIQCLLRGAWFPAWTTNVASSSNGGSVKARIRNRWRFCRLNPSLQCLHYADFPVTSGVPPFSRTPPPISSLSEKIDVSQIVDVVDFRASRFFSSLPKKALPDKPELCFSLLGADSSTPDSANASSPTVTTPTTLSTSLGDFECTSAAQYSEWMDGLLLLLDRDVATKSTGEYVTALADVRVKLAMLDVMGEGVDVPNSVETPTRLPPIFEGDAKVRVWSVASNSEPENGEDAVDELSLFDAYAAVAAEDGK
ncbi:hypothetical protein BJ742DRAFT_843199 [Cladochytrium replicatum]|nr:hypothetical protein BJ742DRAFT_843199 [Cladochytrium replicatum]